MRRTPPWWPEGEPFPPYRRWGGRYGPAPFIRFIGCFFLAILFVALLAGGLLGALLGREGGGHSFFPFFLIPIFGVIVIVVATAAGIRRIARPIDNLVSAARRVDADRELGQ